MTTTTNAFAVPGEAAGPARNGILQVHPSLRCNLACTHCYSSSGPTARMRLHASTVSRVITDAAGMGYQIVSVSGGEPFMYEDLEAILQTAKSLNLKTTVTTNGHFHNRERLERLRGLIDVLAISLDGPPEIHNQVRQSPKAFDRMQAGIDAFRNAGLPFGFIHTLTASTWQHVPWIAQYAADHGARLLQLHALEVNGRAAVDMRSAGADQETLARVYVMTFVLAARHASQMKIQLDLSHRDLLLDDPELVYAGEAKIDDPHTAARALGLLVLEPDGAVVPVAYGFSRRFQICNALERPLADAWPEYVETGYRRFRLLCREVWNELTGPDAPVLANWYETVVSRSRIESLIRDRPANIEAPRATGVPASP